MKSPRQIYFEMKRSFDFTPVIETALREYPELDRVKAESLLDAFLQWFSLVPSMPEGGTLQMLHSVDRMWHALILNTKIYRELCDRFIGRFVDHDPTDVMDDELPKAEYAEYTFRLLKESFGDDLNHALTYLSGKVTCCCNGSKTSSIRSCSSCSHMLMAPIDALLSI